MGNNAGKKECDPSKKNLDELFSSIASKKAHILRSDLKRAWGSQIDNDLYNDVELYLFRENHNELTSQTFKKFFSDICKGDSDDKVEVLCKLLGDNEEISRSSLLKFIQSILKSILIIQKAKSVKRYESWSSRTSQDLSLNSLTEYGEYLLQKIHKSDKKEYSKEDLRSLMINFDYFLLMILSCLYNTEENHFYKNLLPKWKYCNVDSGKNLEQISVLDILNIMFINLEIPADYQSEWRLLFSSHHHGESFSRFSGQIINKGPNIIIIKDKEGHVFGGFCPFSWRLGPNFFGDTRSFLFTLKPEMNIYKSSHFNDNFQYMNTGQQTMPNGLGMGGKLEYFGFWIDAEFGKGYCSESCTTYRNYKMMSGSKNFQIAHLEVWGVGPPPLTAAELGERSVLDSDMQAKAILEMSGKTSYSDGLREDIDN